MFFKHENLKVTILYAISMPREFTYTSVRLISPNSCDYNKLDLPHQIEEGKPFGNLTKNR
jgi:hypothetical protein